MAYTELSLKTLGALNDGTAEAIINHEIALAIRDVDDRGSEDEKPRKVAIEIAMTPRKDGCVEVEVAALAKLPPRRCAPTVARPSHKEDRTSLWFQEFNAENPDQATFPEMDKSKKSKE